MKEEFPNIESENFKKFIEQFRKKEIIEKKQLCRIILFGSYYPPKEKEFLIKIRDALRNDGYNKTWLVENYPNCKGLGIREKSILCLEYSHINFFIITFEGVGKGVTVELEEIIRNATKLSFKTVVCYEIKYENNNRILSLSPLQEDGLISAKIKTVEFKKDNFDDLFELIRGLAWELHYHFVFIEKTILR